MSLKTFVNFETSAPVLHSPSLPPIADEGAETTSRRQNPTRFTKPDANFDEDESARKNAIISK